MGALDESPSSTGGVVLVGAFLSNLRPERSHANRSRRDRGVAAFRPAATLQLAAGISLVLALAGGARHSHSAGPSAYCGGRLPPAGGRPVSQALAQSSRRWD